MSSAHFLAIDLGASSGRFVDCLWTGERFRTQELHRFPNGPVSIPGELCWDALGLWQHILDGLTRFHAAVDEDPCGVSVDGWGVDFALLDHEGRLIANPVSYRDARTSGIARRLFETVPEREWFAETGTFTMEINTLFQLSSMICRGDRRLSIADKMLLIPDFFLYLLGGVPVAEFTVATTTQMYSMTRRCWASPLLERVGIEPSLLPPVISSGCVVSRVRPEVTEKTGLRRSFPVIAAASHDTASAVASIPELDMNSVFLSCGTWSLIGIQTAEADVSPRAYSLGFTNEGAADGGVLLIRNLTGLWTLQECLRVWKVQASHFSWHELCQAAAAAPSFTNCFDPDDPRLHGGSAMPEMLAAYFRETGQPAVDDPGAVARADFESLALKYRATVESLKTLSGRNLSTIRLVGGGSLNRLLCQMIADATNCVVVAGPAEASALGNAMIQAVATGHIGNLASGRDAIAASLERATYHPSRSSGWEEAYAKFLRLEVCNRH